MKVSDLLVDESKWVQNTAAVDQDGQSCSPHAKTAAKFCLLGAIDRCYSEPERYYEIRKKVKEVIAKLFGIKTSITMWNDATGRRFAEVREVVEKANI